MSEKAASPAGQSWLRVRDVAGLHSGKGGGGEGGGLSGSTAKTQGGKAWGRKFISFTTRVSELHGILSELLPVAYWIAGGGCGVCV